MRIYIYKGRRGGLIVKTREKGRETEKVKWRSVFSEYFYRRSEGDQTTTFAFAEDKNDGDGGNDN